LPYPKAAVAVLDVKALSRSREREIVLFGIA
jgi:hypothetical protein